MAGSSNKGTVIGIFVGYMGGRTKSTVFQPEEYKLTVRAIDKAGKIQTSEVTEPFPDGSTGYHMINIQA